MATLSQLKQQYTYKTGVSSLLTENQRQTIMTHLQEEEEARRNQGGFFGGIGYAFEKLGLGFLSSIEGIWDYTAGGLAKLFGADEWAEQQFANDWANYNHADEWFNPSEGWQFVGDVAGGIGTSLPAIATVVAAGAIAVASGGTLSPVAAALISGAVAGLGAAGNATKQAYRETGELGGKEFGYGALVGTTEGAVEGLSAGIGTGTGQIVKGISKSFGKEVAETVTRQTIGKAMIKGFIGEAFEEGLSEILDPVWARMTYDPNAKNATLQEVGYAALVGGLSGAIMGGVGVSIRNVHSMSRGSTIVQEGKSSNVISMAEQLSTYESENHTGYEQFEMVNTTLKELQTSMQKTNGEIRTAKQRMLLGVLEKANTTAAFTPFIARSAENIVNNADVIAEKLTAYGIKDAQGNPVTFTAEQIRSGVDTKNTSTFVNALKTNSVLRALAVADATGRLSMDTAKFKDATLRGQQLSTQADLNQFIENATDVERQAVGERLGISDWNTLTNEQFQQKIVEFSQNGGVEAYQQEQATVRELQNIDPATAKKMPARLNLKKDGTVRYTNGAVNIAVTKNGDTYRIYDYDSGKYSKPLTQAEANRTIREIKKAQAAAPAVTPATVENQQATDTQGTQQQTAPQNGTEQQGAVRKIAEQLNSERQQTQEIDTYARKNVSDYAKLNEPNKSIIRSVIRQGRAAGIADADVLSYARVAAHTGINVVFDKSLCAVAVNSQTGEKIYSDGYYDPETNRFVINPETTHTHEALLLHELTHAIYRTVDGKLILERGVKNMSQAEKDAIIKRYSNIGHGGAIELMDEINARYAEGVLTNKNTIEKLVAEKPKLKDRILSFFKKSSTAYEGDTKLSKSAKSLYNRYKKLFDSFSERNRQYNAAEYRHTAPNAETRYALQEALQQLGEYDETRKRHIESREGDTISRNYGDIVEFIKTAKRLPPVKRLHIGIISDATAKLVKTKTDVDIKNYDFVLASNFISHIFDSHGTQRTETPRNQKAVTYANIENIIETVIAPDDVTLASDENGTALKFIKELDGKNVALTITSTKKSTLTLKSAWIIENSEGRTPSANATASARTSETSGRNLTTDSISENGKKVNRNGKKDGKRYALQIGNETAQVDIEETKNLVALHNLSEEKLLKVLQLGGFPMPSIAVTKAELSHTDYGNITVIFGKETISPTDRRNKVYKRDAWTPTMPQVDVKFNTKEFQTMEDAFCDLVGENETYQSDIRRFFDEFHNYNGDYYVSERDYDSSLIAKKAERYAGVMAAYLSEKGKRVEPVYKDRKFMQGDFTASEIRDIADRLGITQENLKEFYEAQAQGSVEQTRKYQSVMGELKRAYIENYTRRGIDSKSATEIADDLGYSDYSRCMDAIRSILRNPDAKEYDSRATEETLRNNITDTADFEKWLFDKISATEERRGIENGADPFTASGKRRSFAQMHDEYSIQNIVRNMLRGEQHGSTFFGHNANSIAARLADEFTSIKSIKEASYLLTEISESEYDALMDKTFEMSSEIIEEIDTRSGKNGYSDSLTRREDILDMIAECATVRPLTAERILSKWNSQYQGYDLGYKFDKQTAQKVLDWFTVLKQLPTKYFEAKPRRVVEFSEIKSVLIPESASEKLKTRLTNRGVPYQVYGEGENARTDIIKTMDGIRFALPETDSDGRRLTEQQRKYFQNSKIVDNNGKLLPVYHGSNEYGEITVFKKGKTGYLGGGIYLTTDKQYAQRYANKNGYEGRIYEAYLNVSNPLTVTTVDPAREILHAVYGSDRVYNNRTANQGSAMHLITSADINKLQAKGYDGIVWNYGGSKEISVFDSNQIKLVSNQNPTTSRDIRYALPPVEPVKPSSKEWNPTIDTQEAKRRFPNLWDIQQDSSETRNPTQIKGTVTTYKKIYDYLRSHGFEGKILDASSGLGYGTRAGIEEYGFRVEDIEPFPDKSYKPQYTDYSKLTKKYDAIISNAVLNVLPQDQRDALVIKMGSLLNEGGTLFVNVRGDDVNNLASNSRNVNISNMEWYVDSTGSYQKGFTRPELVAYLRDALGEGFTVEPATFFGKTSAIVRKGNRYALPEIDSAGKKLTEQQRKFFRDSRVVDKKGQLLAVYHGTDEQFTVFDKSKFGSKTDAGIYGQGFYFAADKGEALAYGASAKKYYLNIKNPLRISRDTGYSSVLDFYLKQRGIFCKTNGELVDLLNSGFVIPSKAEITSVIQQNGYDGVIYEGYAPSEYVAFEPEQIKLATAKKPTQNKDIRYSLPKDAAERNTAYIAAVERGDIETAQRFVDEAAKEAGYKLRVYHGTPTGGFTVFKTLPAYVTENQSYAERYQSESASSIRFGKRATTPEVKGLYLNTRYLFDTRRPAVQERFYNDYVQGGEMNGYDWCPVSGLNTELTERGLPDWTEGESIADYIRAKKLKYNAIVLDEGKTGGYGLEIDDRGISFAVMNPSALKSADAITYDDNGKIIPLSERFKATEKDIRYALPDDDFQNRVKAAQDFRDEARQYGRRVKVNYDGSVTVYHGTSAANANNILSTGVINEQSYFTTNKSEADYYANGKHSGGVVLELHIDARNLEFAAAGAEIYAPARLERVDGVFVNKDGRRYALKGDRTPVDGMSRGQRAKFAANNTRPKVYSKIDATEIVNSIIDERLVFDDKYGSLSGKSRAQVIDTLFTKLNNTSEGYRIGVALDIADYIINNAVLTDMYDSYDDVSYAMETLSVIRRYMHKVDLRGIKGEIQHKFDKKNAVSLVWGAKQGGMAPDVIAQELQSYGINIEAINEADQFFEMLEIYEKAKSDVSKKAEKVSLTAYGSKAQIEKLRQQIARDILTAYDEKGTQSKYGKLVEKYTNQIESLTKQVRQARKINSVVNSLVDSAQYLRDIAAKRNYVGAEVFSAPELTSWLKNLGKLKYRSDLRKSGARKILLDYGKFYNTNNPLLYDADPNLTYIDNNVLDALNFLQQNADSTKPLSLEELQAAQVIMASAKHLFQNYDQMTMEGKKVRISEAATAGNAIIQRTKSRVGRGFFNSIYGVFNKIVEPRVVIKSFENYDPNGILTRAYNEITRGETAASLQYIQLVEKFDDYFKTNKKYRKRLTSEYITVAGAELNVGQALSLYELSKREQAKAGLYEAGFSYIDKKGKKQTVSITESDIDALQSAFTESDKQFISIVEEFFNVQSKKVKTDADLQILGYTNASDDFYFPIQRDKGTIAKNITDARDLMADWANVYNFSFNKDVKTGAKNKIFVPEIWSVITRHAKQLSTYAHLTVPLKNFSQIYAKNIGDKTHVQSIRNTLNEQVWGGADAYLSKLFADIQGKATSSSVIEKLRGAYAKYQLGANLKVIVSQLTSYPTAGIELDFRSMVKGAVMKTDYAAMDKYCDYARVRNYEKGVVRAEGVIDKVGKIGDIFTKPIQWTDRAAIGKIWNACQVQIERNDGHKIGTVENMQAAGVLLEEVIRLTQPNYTNTERSALMRSDSDIVRSFTMFTSVPLKQLSRLVESVGEYKTLRQMIKSGDTNADIQSRYKKAKKRLGKTLASITVANLMYTMVAQFFKWLYAKDRKDKDGNEISFVQDFFTDFASTTIGMFPVVKDIYNYFANDYEFSNFAYDSINSILSTTKDLFEVATKAAGGESLETSDYMKPLRNSLYAIGQITGLPIRNINNTISGVIKRFSPATAYKYNSMFYNAQYSKDIKAALANGDTELADTIMSLMLDEDKAGNLSAGARKKLIELYEQEYEVLPRSIGDSVTYNGEKIELTAKQREKFKRVYGQANGYIERMVQNKSFAKLSANKQAKAIKQVYDAYYDKALAETLGVSSDNKLLLLSKFMGIESLSIALAGISDITSDKDKNGATVQGSKKKKVIQYLLGLNFTDAQRLLILFMQGYKIGDGEYKRLTADRAKRMVISYILSLNKATQAEKAQLAQMCGAEVKNGRIVTKSLYAAK